MGDITRLLVRWGHGDGEAFEALVPIVYEELRKLADHYLRHERPDHTLQPTALVHEAYLRLAGIQDMELRNRAHFYGAAAQIMRRVLVDHSRQRRALKRGGPDIVVPLDETIDAAIGDGTDLVALDEALNALDAIAPARARVVELRYFGGLSLEETAEALHVSIDTVKRDWRFAKLWLLRELRR